MELLYGKRFSKDLDGIRHEAKVRENLEDVIKGCRVVISSTPMESSSILLT